MSQIFSYQSQQVRTVTESNEPWFAAIDVCRALDISWSGSKILKGFPPDWQRVAKLTTHRRGSQSVIIISEPAVYKLAFRSNKPEADTFTNWVASEVLPTIRKTGKYKAAPPQLSLSAPAEPQPDLAAMRACILATTRTLKDQTLDLYGVLDRRLRHSGKFRHGHNATEAAYAAHRSLETLHRSLDYLVDSVQANAQLVMRIAAM